MHGAVDARLFAESQGICGICHIGSRQRPCRAGVTVFSGHCSFRCLDNYCSSVKMHTDSAKLQNSTLDLHTFGSNLELKFERPHFSFAFDSIDAAIFLLCIWLISLLDALTTSGTSVLITASQAPLRQAQDMEDEAAKPIPAPLTKALAKSGSAQLPCILGIGAPRCRGTILVPSCEAINLRVQSSSSTALIRLSMGPRYRM